MRLQKAFGPFDLGGSPGGGQEDQSRTDTAGRQPLGHRAPQDQRPRPPTLGPGGGVGGRVFRHDASPRNLPSGRGVTEERSVHVGLQRQGLLRRRKDEKMNIELCSCCLSLLM